MSADPGQQELATTGEWREKMSAARRAAGLTQGELGRKVGTSQNMISNIESGQVGSSKFILPICKVLAIEPPMFFEDEDEKLWSQLGHLLRRRNAKQFRRALALVESMIDEAPAANDGTPTEAQGPDPRK